MSIKSLLQFILLCLIVLIIGGIYFLYFSSKPSEKTVLINNVENEMEKTLDDNNNQDDELLEGNSRIEEENIDKKKNKTNILGTNQHNKSVNKKSSADKNIVLKLLRTIKEISIRFWQSLEKQITKTTIS